MSEETKKDAAESSSDEKQPFMERFKAFVNEYGAIAVVTWFTIFFATWGAFAALLGAGLDLGTWLSGDGEGDGWLWNLVKGWGTIGLAYIPTQLVKPFRAAATFAITPAVHRFLRGNKKPQAEASADEQGPSDEG